MTTYSLELAGRLRTVTCSESSLTMRLGHQDLTGFRDQLADTSIRIERLINANRWASSQRRDRAAVLSLTSTPKLPALGAFTVAGAGAQVFIGRCLNPYRGAGAKLKSSNAVTLSAFVHTPTAPAPLMCRSSASM